jgi:D-sedoheptulose 7-phosphate isomerase
MSSALGAGTLERCLTEGLAERTRANREFFDREAERLARTCHRMAERFARGGRLIAVGESPAARSDARHVAVEFVHPVIVGKRALPAIGLAGEGGAVGAQLDLVAEPDDIVIAFEVDAPATAAAAELARSRGCMTIAFAPSRAEFLFEPPTVDPAVRQELVETLYHVLWELVHVFFEHRGLLEGRSTRTVHDSGASSFLYPFLGEQEHDLEAVVADVRESVRAKAHDIGYLRAQTLVENAGELVEAAIELRQALDAGGRLIALGNGGSATDAMDVVADFRMPYDPAWPARRALDLTEDSAILTAIANDIGPEAIFARQVIAYGRRGDVVLALSTSGNSANVISALAEARRREIRTIAMVGYDGGRVASERLADHVVVTRSEHIPRIQEAQASAYHSLRRLVEVAAP